MENTLKINDQQLMIKEYEGLRVVTMWDISNLHGVDTRNIRKNFENNCKYLVKGEDYYLLEKRDDFVVNLIHKEDLKKNAVSRAKDIPVFTETGYLMMTKPMTDELSWKVQKQLINSYFKVKEIAKAEIALTKSEELKQLQNLSEINKTIELMDSMFKTSRISDKQRMQIVSSLLENAGVELPEIKIAETLNKINYITLEELAARIGLYREDKTSNVEAAMYFVIRIKATLDDLRLILKNNDSGHCWFSIKFNPLLIESITRYLEYSDYPKSIEFKQVDGSIVTVPVYYY